MAQGRRQIATTILTLQKKIAPDLLKIDECKEALRGEIQETGEGFTEEVPGLGTVEGKAGSEAKLKGILPVLDASAFLTLPESRREKLLGDGLVINEEQWQPARKPSVTVRL